MDQDQRHPRPRAGHRDVQRRRRLQLLVPTRTAAPYTGLEFVGLTPWDERGAGLPSTVILASLNKKFAAIADGRVIAVAPPAIPGISSAGGFSVMLQDRAGSSYEFLAANVAKFVAEARKRPELEGVRPNFSPAVPQLYADVDKEKAMKEGVAEPGDL